MSIFTRNCVIVSNKDCGYTIELVYQLGSSEYPQPMFYEQRYGKNAYPVNPYFTIWACAWEDQRFAYAKTKMPLVSLLG